MRVCGANGCLAVTALLALAGGCGDEEEPPKRPVPDPSHAAEVERDPYAITCGDLANQPTNAATQRLVIHAEFALAQVPELREQVEKQTLSRAGRSVYFALTETCKGRDASFKPARLAVAGVRDGKYRAAKNRPG